MRKRREKRDLASFAGACRLFSSINVKPFPLCMAFALLFQRKITSFVGMLICDDYNAIGRDDARKKYLGRALFYRSVNRHLHKRPLWTILEFGGHIWYSE